MGAKADVTIEYYNRNAARFLEDTAGVGFTEIQNAFLNLLPEGARILDFGCGSGRDALKFLKRGYQVEATDGSEEMRRAAAELTGLAVRQMLFQELDEKEKYDGIWACSSILHLPKSELGDVLERMTAALKINGVIYTSFKYGAFEGERNGRYFTDFTEETFTEFIKGMTGVTVEKMWITNDVRPGRGEEKWLNMILRKRAAD
ncbi:class I SAM-dependent methyltransferase [Massilistercora timonensis]|uniref:class I SAM-dependent methyltransferase n=1 Tax=Massilistercora timonensis TaxID=2086584 RepID=UPI00320B5377